MRKFYEKNSGIGILFPNFLYGIYKQNGFARAWETFYLLIVILRQEFLKKFSLLLI